MREAAIIAVSHAYERARDIRLGLSSLRFDVPPSVIQVTLSRMVANGLLKSTGKRELRKYRATVYGKRELIRFTEDASRISWHNPKLA